MKNIICMALISQLLILGGTGIARADWATATVTVGSTPGAVAVNPLTNKIYVANFMGNNVTIIDGSTNTVATVTTGSFPLAIATNPITNKIYVANGNGTTVTVIDGSTNATIPVTVGTQPRAVAVNPATNKIYVANYGSDDVTVINGEDHSTVSVPAGTRPCAVAVNPVTNRVYVANEGSQNITVIDGGIDSVVVTVIAGDAPVAVAVNPVTNMIYAANTGSNNITVINGAGNTIDTTIAAGSSSCAVAVNPVTNMIYVANGNGASITVLNGATKAVTTISAGTYPNAVAVNPAANKIYVTNGGSDNVTVIDGATNAAATVSAGSNPRAVAVNPVTGKIYAVNQYSASVTVIDGSANLTASVATGSNPRSVAVNSVTNKIYVGNDVGGSFTVINGMDNTSASFQSGSSTMSVAVNAVTNKIYLANWGSNNVTVVDGGTNDTVNVPVGSYPVSVALNPLTNMAYVANAGSDNVSVIDGANQVVATINTGDTPNILAVNPVTNKVYVTHKYSPTVLVIDGKDNSTVSVPAGDYQYDIAVNPVTNKIYAVNAGSNSVTVIDGATNGAVDVPVGAQPYGIGVNPVTNKIYVANWLGDNVTMIDGLTNDTMSVPAGTKPRWVTVNPVTNKIYVSNDGSNNVTVIDGATNSTSTVTAGNYPFALAVNPVTNRVYVTNYLSSNVTVIDAAREWDTQVAAVLDSIPGNKVYSFRPVISGHAANRWNPNKTGLVGVLGDWLAGQQPYSWVSGPAGASPDSIGWTYAWGSDSLLWGENFINIIPMESQSAITNNLGMGTPMAGNMLTYPVYYLDNIPPSTAVLLSPANDTLMGDSLIVMCWNGAADNYGMGQYLVQCSADNSFSLTLLDTMVRDTTVSFVLSAMDTTYYWRVGAVDVCGNIGEYSAIWQFEIDVTSPAVPVQLTPADNSWLASDTAFCTWSAVSKKTKASPVYYVLKAYSLSDTINPVVVDTTSLTADTLLVSENRYRWLVEAYDEAGNLPGISGLFSFGYDTTAPAVATLLSPADSLATNQSNTGFAWNVCSDGISGLKNYTLQYAYDAGFTEGLAETTLTDTSIALILADSNYYWRVVAVDTAGNSSLPNIRYLSIDTYDPAIPTLASPANSLWLDDTTVVCSWSEVTKKVKGAAVEYVIQLDTSNTFAMPLYEDTTGILLDTFNLAEDQYYWRVMAYDLAGNYGTYSGYRSFGVDITAPDIQYILALSDDASAPYGPYEVSSKVYDLSLKSAWMFTQVNGGSWDSTAMFSALDSLRDSIPALSPSTDETLTVSYYVKAWDMPDHQSTSATYSFKAIGPLGVEGNPPASLPLVYALNGAYPNPSKGQTTFKYQLPRTCNVSLTVYNVAGQAVKRFELGSKPAGYHTVNWNANQMAAGIYIYRLQAGEFSSNKKMMIVK